MKGKTIIAVAAAVASMGSLTSAAAGEQDAAARTMPSISPASASGRTADASIYKIAPLAQATPTREGGAMPDPKAGAKPDDATITARVKAALESDRSIDAKKVAVDTSGGKVTLQGEMPKAQIAHAVQIARAVEGVQDVVNKLRPAGAG